MIRWERNISRMDFKVVYRCFRCLVVSGVGYELKLTRGDSRGIPEGVKFFTEFGNLGKRKYI